VKKDKSLSYAMYASVVNMHTTFNISKTKSYNLLTRTGISSTGERIFSCLHQGSTHSTFKNELGRFTCLELKDKEQLIFLIGMHILKRERIRENRTKHKKQSYIKY
jgi:hypothetical protein